MTFDDPRALWDAHAHTDPLWAVLSAPDKTGRRWRLRDFMESGEREIGALMHQLARLGLSPRGPVLDFGCGVGRLSQALGRRFDDVVGVDISPAMVALAERVNQYPDRVRYTSAGLEALATGSLGFIYSNIVLQHMAPAHALRAIGEFLRLLRPGGLVVFQLPSHETAPRVSEIVAMAEDAYLGSIALAGGAPTRVGPGEEIVLPILVRNSSGRTWSQPGAGPMAAGNHWLDASGEMLVQDDGRAPLPQVMTAGTESRLVLRMRAPGESGSYICEVDLVHEGVTWFARRGSPTLRFRIEVAMGVPIAVEGHVAPVALVEYDVPEYPDDALPPPSTSVEAPPADNPFPMNGVPQEDVLRVMARHGGRVAHIEEDRHAGADWVSYTYFVTQG